MQTKANRQREERKLTELDIEEVPHRRILANRSLEDGHQDGEEDHSKQTLITNSLKGRNFVFGWLPSKGKGRKERRGEKVNSSGKRANRATSLHRYFSSNTN